LKIKHPVENKLCKDVRKEEQMKAKRAKFGHKIDENQQLIEHML